MKELLTFLFVMAAHETGHIAAAFLCGAKVKMPRIVFGGIRIEITEKEKTSYFKMLFITLGGAAVNFLLFACPFLGRCFRLYNLGCAFFNLLPLYCSDGGEAVMLILFLILNDPDAAVKIKNVICNGTLFGLWILAVYFNIVGTGALPMLVSVTVIIVIGLWGKGGREY